MYSMIKEIADRSVQSNLNIDLKLATVLSKTELQLDQGLILPIAPCLAVENIGGLSLVINGVKHCVRRPVNAGDRLLLLQIGNNYCVIDRLGDLFADNSVVIKIGS